MGKNKPHDFEEMSNKMNYSRFMIVIGLLFSMILCLSCRKQGKWRTVSATKGFGSTITTSHGFFTGSVDIEYGDGKAVFRYPMLVWFHEHEWVDIPQGYSVITRKNGDHHRTVFGKRVNAKEGSVVFCDLATSSICILDGIEWQTNDFFDEQLNPNENAVKAFLKSLIDKKIIVVPTEKPVSAE